MRGCSGRVQSKIEFLGMRAPQQRHLNIARHCGKCTLLPAASFLSVARMSACISVRVHVFHVPASIMCAEAGKGNSMGPSTCTILCVMLEHTGWSTVQHIALFSGFAFALLPASTTPHFLHLFIPHDPFHLTYWLPCHSVSVHLLEHQARRGALF